MISAKSLQDAVYGAIFPGGMIPLRCKDLIPAIDARIKEIAELAEGKTIEGMNRRLGKADSQALTEQIVQLRDSCEPPMSYREIMRRLGNVISPDAARNRYDDVKRAAKDAEMQREGYAALSGEAIQAGTYKTPPEVQEKINLARNVQREETVSPKPQEPIILGTVREGCRVLRHLGKMHRDETINSSDHIADPNEMVAATAEDGKSKENETDILPTAPAPAPDGLPANCEEATTRNSRMVQEIQEDKRDLTTKQLGHINGPKIPHSEDEFILRLRAEGKIYREIHEALLAKGITCTLDDVTARHTSEKRKREKAQNVEKRTSAPQNVSPAQPDAAKPQSLPGAEGAQDAARANPRGTPEENPEPKFISRYALNEKVWNLHKQGKTPGQISDELCQEGYYYGVDRVRRMLIQQGADI
ncbi:hypothetical protein M0R72_17785 [Candidatus Pacearchaeota archaeon]|nr:hypothetical protein [Candidatus Pacearchaeota archaeon]